MDMNKKIFSRGWFKALFLMWFKDFFWLTISVIVIFVSLMIILTFFSYIWGLLTLFGVIVVICLVVFLFLYI